MHLPLVKFIYSEKATYFLRNLYRRFVLCSKGQIYGGDFAKNMWPSQNIWSFLVCGTCSLEGPRHKIQGYFSFILTKKRIRNWQKIGTWKKRNHKNIFSNCCIQLKYYNSEPFCFFVNCVSLRREQIKIPYILTVLVSIPLNKWSWYC